MASINLSGVLRDPTGEFAVGDKVRFTHKSTTGETPESAVSELTIGPTGAYNIDLEYGLVLVEYNDVRRRQYKNLGVATVNQDNPATSIPELLNALVPASSPELIEFQAILADCITAQNEAELSAIDAGNSALIASSAAEIASNGAEIYVDTAAGLAATIDGDYFSVASSTAVYTDLYRNNLGVADFINSLPSKKAVEEPEKVTNGRLTTINEDSEIALDGKEIKYLNEIGEEVAVISEDLFFHKSINSNSADIENISTGEALTANSLGVDVEEKSYNAFSISNEAAKHISLDTLSKKLRLRSVSVQDVMDTPPESGLGLNEPPVMLFDTTNPVYNTRTHQGIASIAKCGSSLWAIWYGHNTDGEAPGNFCIIANSSDNGDTWSDDYAYIAYPDNLTDRRVFDPQAWCDNDGRLWLILSVSASDLSGSDLFDGIEGVWAITSNNPEAANPSFSKAFKISSYGIGMRPFDYDRGHGMPVDYWTHAPDGREIKKPQFSGKSLHIFNGGDLGLRSIIPSTPTSGFSETSIVQRGDGSLLAVWRVSGAEGIYKAESEDGTEWINVEQYAALGDLVSSRASIIMSPAGRVAIAYNNSLVGRFDMTIKLSDDGGATFPFSVLVDAGSSSYPVLEINQDSGEIYIVYDKGRETDREILFAKFLESDIVAGTAVSNPIIINKAV